MEKLTREQCIKLVNWAYSPDAIEETQEEVIIENCNCGQKFRKKKSDINKNCFFCRMENKN